MFELKYVYCLESPSAPRLMYRTATGSDASGDKVWSDWIPVPFESVSLEAFEELPR